MTTSNIGLVEGLTVILLLASGFGLVWRIAQVEKAISDRINTGNARADLNAANQALAKSELEKLLTEKINNNKAAIDALIASYSSELKLIELKLEQLNDQTILATNGLKENIAHNRTRLEIEITNVRSLIKDLQSFLEKHQNFVPRRD